MNAHAHVRILTERLLNHGAGRPGNCLPIDPNVHGCGHRASHGPARCCG